MAKYSSSIKPIKAGALGSLLKPKKPTNAGSTPLPPASSAPVIKPPKISKKGYSLGLGPSKGVNGQTVYPGFGYTPFDPLAPPPSSTYDPALDAEADKSGRLYGYTKEDANKNIGRATSNYAVDTENLNRDFVNLASRQNQSNRAAGIELGGAGTQAAGIRGQNQARGQGSLKLAFDRYIADQNTGLTRAGTEDAAFQTATQSSRVAQATAQGWHPETLDAIKASGHTINPTDYKDAKGPYRLAKNNRSGRWIKVRPNGSVEKR